MSWAISERRSFCSVVSNFRMNFVHTRVIPKILFKISQTVVFGIPRSFFSSRTVNRRSPLIASRTRSCFPVLLSAKVGQNEGHCQQMCGHFQTGCTTPLSVLCPYFHPQRPSVSFPSSPYNSCPDWSETWCKFVGPFFLSFSTVNKCDERKKHVGHKHTLRTTQGVRPVTTAFREFVRDYSLRSYPAEAARALWREDINAGRILFGHTSYLYIPSQKWDSCREYFEYFLMRQKSKKNQPFGRCSEYWFSILIISKSY